MKVKLLSALAAVNKWCKLDNSRERVSHEPGVSILFRIFVHNINNI